MGKLVFNHLKKYIVASALKSYIISLMIFVWVYIHIIALVIS